jgi:hypothetical protein
MAEADEVQNKEARFFPPDGDDVSKPLGYIRDANKALANLMAWSDKYFKEVDDFPVVGDKEAQKAKSDALLLCRTLESQAKFAMRDMTTLAKHCQELQADLMDAFHNPMGLGKEQVMDFTASDGGLYSPIALEHMVSTLPFEADSREEVMKGFKETNPDMSEEDLEAAADQWEKNKNVVKDKTGDPVDATSEKQASYSYVRAAYPMLADWEPLADRDEVKDKFKEHNPDMGQDDLQEVADAWDENKDVVKDKSAFVASYGYRRVSAERWLPTKTKVWFKLPRETYFYCLSINKNGGMSGVLVEPPRSKSGRGAPIAKKYNTGALFKGQDESHYKEVSGVSIPAEIMEAAKKVDGSIKEASYFVESAIKWKMEEDDMIKMFEEAGLKNLGTRYGKRGDNWGKQGGSMMIRLGGREASLTKMAPDGVWGQHDYELLSKLDREKLAKWIGMIKNAPTMVQVRNSEK